MEDLTERKQQILRAVVIEYVDTAEPVGSHLLVKRYDLGVGPATVRHELAEMSERGYLEQPHTSAGRIPSDTGYRYYVDRLAEREIRPEAERQVRELSKTDTDLNDLLVETCRLLARLTQSVSIAATVKDGNVSVRSISLSSVTPDRALLVVILSNGGVENRIVPAAPHLTLAELHEVAAVLTKAAEGVRLRAVTRQSAPDPERLKPAAQELLARSWKALRSVCRSLSTGKVVAEGTVFLLGEPEFQRNMGALAEIVSVLEDEQALHGALERPAESGTSVTIGKENPSEALKRLAVIASRFYLNDQEAGAIAVVGPTRMRYASTIPLVETAARALSDALTKLLR